MDAYNGEVFNVGGGSNNSISLRELSALCEEVTKIKIDITYIPEVREADIPYYVSDISKINGASGWKPMRDIRTTVEDITSWISGNKQTLEALFQ